MSAQAVGALERGDRRFPQRETLAMLTQALGLDADRRSEFESAARRQVTPGPWTSVPIPMLPSPVSSYVGNVDEVRQIVDSLRVHRLVTITGPGGIGKTRTALVVGASLAETPQSCVRFVELAPISDGNYITTAIAAALGLQQVPEHAMRDTLQAHLQREATILIFDNCEHLIAEVATVAADLLRACPPLQMLTTSREPLRISGELVYRMSPLAFPDAKTALTLAGDAAVSYPAIELFVQRPRDADRRFELTDRNAPAIAAICAQLDGMPLAIELAAARTTTIPVAAMAERLSSRFALLSHGERTAHARHRTMWASITWSYELLTESERLLFDRLSMFVGRFTADAAAAVCAGDGIDEAVVGDLLDALVEKSLLVADVTGDEPRYAMLESFREFGRTNLGDRESLDSVARRHARVYLERMEHSLAALEYEREDETIASVKADLENWRAATGWAFGPMGDPDLGQRLILPIAWWLTPPEAVRWMNAARAHANGQSSNDLIARMSYIDAGLEAVVSGNLAPAIENADESLAYFDAIGDTLWALRAAFRSARYLLYTRRFSEAAIALDQTIDRARACGATRTVAQARVQLGRMHAMRGDFAAARVECTAALPALEALHSLEGRSLVFEILADVEMRSDNPSAALVQYRAQLECARERDDALSLGVTLTNLAWCLIALGHFDEASGYVREALDYSVRYDMRTNLLYVLDHLAAIKLLCDGPDKTARAIQAAHVIGYVDARRAATPSAARETGADGEYKQILSTLAERLDAPARDAALAAGAEMTQIEVIELAIDTSPLYAQM